MSVYHSVLTNLYGEDRVAAVRAMDNDADFDRWMRDFDAKTTQKSGGGKGVRISNEQYLERYAVTYGGEE